MGQIAAAIAAFFNWMTGRNATKNAAPIVQAKTAQNAVASVDKTNAAIAAKDTKEIQNELAE